MLSNVSAVKNFPASLISVAANRIQVNPTQLADLVHEVEKQPSRSADICDERLPQRYSARETRVSHRDVVQPDRIVIRCWYKLLPHVIELQLKLFAFDWAGKCEFQVV